MVDDARETRKDTIYAAWGRWCKATGRDHVGTTQVFSRNLRSALPYLTDYEPRVAGKQVPYWRGVALQPHAETYD